RLAFFRHVLDPGDRHLVLTGRRTLLVAGRQREGTVFPGCATGTLLVVRGVLGDEDEDGAFDGFALVGHLASHGVEPVRASGAGNQQAGQDHPPREERKLPSHSFYLSCELIATSHPTLCPLRRRGKSAACRFLHVALS